MVEAKRQEEPVQAVEEPTDRELVERAQGGSYSAFEELVRRYSSKVYSLALGMTKNEVDAEEVLQDTFLNVFRKLGSFRGESAFSSWLYRVTTNAALMKLRKRRRRPQVSFEELLPKFKEDGHHLRPVGDWSRRADERMENSELGDKIEEAIAKLPEKYRIVLLMRDVEGLSNQEIGESLGLSIPTIKSRLHRSRLFLREELTHYFTGE